MGAATRVFTAEELWRNPPGERCELLRGELVVMSPAGSEHGWVVINVSLPLAAFVKDRRLGYVFGAETGFLIHRNPDSVRAPDVAFVRRSRVSGPLPSGFFPGPPDLAIEVLSPGDAASQVQEKTEDWLRAGCSEVWLIDLRRKSASRCTRRDDAIDQQAVRELTSDLLPGFVLQVNSLFE